MGVLAASIAVFAAMFMRDPERVPGPGIISPADGKVREILERDGMTRISIFMNVHNVHVNRVPMKGKVAGLEYRKGAHRPAYKKESDANERNRTYLDTEIGQVVVTQIAGSFARRIHVFVKEGERVKKGTRLGRISFGSRVDIDLPSDKVIVKVKPGEKMKANMTTIAEIKGPVNTTTERVAEVMT